ncbi:Protein fluG [Leucoagaricus sp. SymC.cos]|nr:Protein fluG [Leucoagaricus sp. SymC.cos]
MSTQIGAGHGLIHTPSSVAAASAALTIQDLKSAGIKHVRILWVEPTNIVRLRVLPISYFEKLMKSSRPGIGVPKVTGGFVYLFAAEGYGSAGEYLLVPDLASLKKCPYAPGHASIMGWFEEKDPFVGPDGQLSVKVPMCPRSKLRELVDIAKEDGVEFLVGFESEFCFLESTNPVKHANIHQYSDARGLIPSLRESQCLEEIVNSLIDSGVQVETWHCEAGPGQYEISTGPQTPIAGVDTLIHTRETIINIAAKYGLHATFAPRISMTAPGSAAHVHISVHKAGVQKPKDGLSDLESSFLAGVLDNLTALPAFSLPIPASYRRVADGVWSGGTYVAWGSENRECPIRLSNATSPGSRNFEMRFIDGTANPYLILAAIIGLGYAGVKSNRTLVQQNFSGNNGPAQLTEEERRAMGVTQRMPLTWDESRRNLAQSETLRDVLGSDFVDKYLIVNKVLAEALGIYDGDDEKSLTRLVEFC